MLLRDLFPSNLFGTQAGKHIRLHRQKQKTKTKVSSHQLPKAPTRYGTGIYSYGMPEMTRYTSAMIQKCRYWLGGRLPRRAHLEYARAEYKTTQICSAWLEVYQHLSEQPVRGCYIYVNFDSYRTPLVLASIFRSIFIQLELGSCLHSLHCLCNLYNNITTVAVALLPPCLYPAMSLSSTIDCLPLIYPVSNEAKDASNLLYQELRLRANTQMNLPDFQDIQLKGGAKLLRDDTSYGVHSVQVSHGHHNNSSQTPVVKIEGTFPLSVDQCRRFFYSVKTQCDGKLNPELKKYERLEHVEPKPVGCREAYYTYMLTESLVAATGGADCESVDYNVIREDGTDHTCSILTMSAFHALRPADGENIRVQNHCSVMHFVPSAHNLAQGGESYTDFVITYCVRIEDVDCELILPRQAKMLVKRHNKIADYMASNNND